MTESAETGVLDQLRDLGRQNGATIGRILANGNLGVAEEGSDGKMHATVRIPLQTTTAPDRLQLELTWSDASGDLGFYEAELTR